jgi:hypothetical protein
VSQALTDGIPTTASIDRIGLAVADQTPILKS